jgi:hypothetical protein
MPIPKSLFPAYPEAYSQWKTLLPMLSKGQNKQVIKAAQDLAQPAGVQLKHIELTAKQQAKLIASEDFPPEATAIFLADWARPNITAIKTTPETKSDTHALAHEVHHALVNLNDPIARVAITGPEAYCANFMLEAASNLVFSIARLFPVNKASHLDLTKFPRPEQQLTYTSQRIAVAADQAYKALKDLPIGNGVERAKAHYTNEVQAYGGSSLHRRQIKNVANERAELDEYYTNVFATAYRALEAAEQRANKVSLSV